MWINLAGSCLGLYDPAVLVIEAPAQMKVAAQN